MDNLFLLLFFASIIALVVGLVKPTAFTRFLKEKAIRKDVTIIFGIAAIAFFVLFAITTEPTIQTPQATEENNAPENTEQIIELDNEQVDIQCEEYSRINYCIEVDKHSITSTGEINITTKIENKSNRRYIKLFGSSCTEPVVFINGMFDRYSVACATVMTEVVIKPGDVLEYPSIVSGSKLDIGNNTLSTSWGDFNSPKIEVLRDVDTEQDEKVLLQCLEGISHSSCANLTTFLKNEYYDFKDSCESFEHLYSHLNIKPSSWYCEDGQIGLGIIPFYVPRTEADWWLAEFKKITGFESVYVSD